MHHRPTTFLLVQGAWQGAWCWRALVSLLERAGHRVLTPDLPGLGQDRTPPAACTLAASVQRVLDLVDRASSPVILVGHGLGGMTISQVAEEHPEKIRWLVYLSGLLPLNGETALQTLRAAQGSENPLAGCVECEEGSVRLRFDAAAPLLCDACTPTEKALAEKLLRPQPWLPLQTPVRLSARCAWVPRAFLLCAADRVLPLDVQRSWLNRVPCAQIHRLDCGHAPFWTHPERLAEHLEELARHDPGGDPDQTLLGLPGRWAGQRREGLTA